MKKRIIIVVMSFFICNFIPRFPQHAMASFSSKHHINELSKQLFKAHEAYNIPQVEALLDKALYVFANNAAYYYEFITMPDTQGFTFLQYAAATGDEKSIKRILNNIKNYFKNDIHSILKVLINKGKINHSPLMLLCYINEQQAFSSFINDALQALNNNKEYYAQLLKDAQYDTQWNVFHVLAKNSCNAQCKILIKQLKKLFGKHSSLYDQCLNAYDIFGNSALTYTHSADLKNFLINNGALSLSIDQSMQQRLKKAQQLGRLLISALHNNDFKQYNHLLEYIITQYADSTLMLSSALNAQDENHWTFFHHAAAHNQYDFILSFFATLSPLFEDAQEHFLSVINAKDNEGKTGFMLLLSRKHFSTAHMLISKFKEIIPKKLYFYLTMNNKEEYNGRTPLLAATYNSTDTHDHNYFKTINTMLQTMKTKFPMGSHAFYHFINAQDSTQATSLSYANSAKLRALLIKNGAVDSTTHSSGEERTRFF